MVIVSSERSVSRRDLNDFPVSVDDLRTCRRGRVDVIGREDTGRDERERQRGDERELTKSHHVSMAERAGAEQAPRQAAKRLDDGPALRGVLVTACRHPSHTTRRFLRDEL